MTRKIYLIIVFLLCSILFVNAQNKYPINIMPTQTKTIDAGNDTLWVLSNRQVKRAITDAKKLKVELEITKELRNKISLMEEKSVTKDSLILDLKNDRDYYVKNWNTCKDDVNILIKKCKRQKLFTRLSMGGVVVAFIAGFFIAK